MPAKKDAIWYPYRIHYLMKGTNKSWRHPNKVAYLTLKFKKKRSNIYLVIPNHPQSIVVFLRLDVFREMLEVYEQVTGVKPVKKTGVRELLYRNSEKFKKPFDNFIDKLRSIYYK